MKIAVVSQAYYPRYGGVAENVAHSAAVLALRGHDVSIITGRPVGVGHSPSEAVPRIDGLDLGVGQVVPELFTQLQIFCDALLLDCLRLADLRERRKLLGA